MYLKAFTCFLLLTLAECTSSDDSFVFNGFVESKLKLDGIASVTQNGLLQLTNSTKQMKGHAFHPSPFHFRTDRNSSSISSFSTTFVFAIQPEYSDLGGHGIAFLIAPKTDFSGALPSQYLGLFNSSNIGNLTNHVFAVELDTILSSEFKDINDNHVGIDIDSLVSNQSHAAAYYSSETGKLVNLTLISGNEMQVWINYDGQKTEVNVTIAPIRIPKPEKPLLSAVIDLSTVIEDSMYVGFSSSTGSVFTSHFVLGWSFSLNGAAQALDLSKLPALPRTTQKGRSKVLDIILPLATAAAVLLMVTAVVYAAKRRRKYAEVREDWETQFGTHRFSYKDLFAATKGFRDRELLGVGGFGRVYKGTLPDNKKEIAVKRVSHESRQGMREFVSEIVSIGRVRHRNLVQLLGYCRRKGELLLVYDYMPNGSLDKLLYDETKSVLNWPQRFRIIKGVASGLLYLHEDWEQVVIHRDIKASNVLLDIEMNGRLGDFGLARLYDHGTDPQTTHVVGTMGYLAPELARTGKATTMTDVFAFGAFVLEVACGKRPVRANAQGEHVVLVDWVLESWRKGSIVDTCDPRLRDECDGGEMELVLKVGLLCSHPLPSGRPTMRQVMQYLDGDAALPELSPSFMSFGVLSLLQHEGFDDYVMSFPSSLGTTSGFSAGR